MSPHLEEGHSHLVQDPQSPIQDLPDQERDVEMSKTVPLPNRVVLGVLDGAPIKKIIPAAKGELGVNPDPVLTLIWPWPATRIGPLISHFHSASHFYSFFPRVSTLVRTITRLQPESSARPLTPPGPRLS